MKQILDYRNEQDINFLIKSTRNLRTRKGKVYIRLSSNIIIFTEVSRALINSYLFHIFDYYRISEDRRKELIYIGSYAKGKPLDYMNLVLDIIENDSYFRYTQKEEDYVLLLPHLLAEVKEQFYRVAILVNGMIMQDHSLLSYIKAYRTDKDFKTMIDRPLFEVTDTPWAITDKMNKVMEKLDTTINISPLSDFYKSGVKVNRPQLLLFFSWGLVPKYTNMHELADYPISSGVLNGYNKRKDIHFSDNMGRMVLSATKSEVKAPGYLTKKLTIVLQWYKLNNSATRETTDDCGTKRVQKIKINSAKDLSFYKYKYYCLANEDVNTSTFDKYIHPSNLGLIGKELYIRSIISCDSETNICKKCYGANHMFACDNAVFKANINDSVLIAIAEQQQATISLKHYLGGIYMDSPIDVVDMETGVLSTSSLRDFVEKSELVSSIEYNVIYFNTKHTIVQEPYVQETIYRGKKAYPSKPTTWSIIVDNRWKITSNYRIRKEVNIGEKDVYKSNGYIFTIPNDSMLRKAELLDRCLEKHSLHGISNIDNWDFPGKTLYGEPIDVQLRIVLDYLMSRATFKHIIHYEILTRSMSRDYSDETKNVTADTELLKFIHINNVSNRPSSAPSISTLIPYGKINKVLNAVHNKIRPEEYDLIFTNLTDNKERTDDTYRSMNGKWVELTANEMEHYDRMEKEGKDG